MRPARFADGIFEQRCAITQSYWLDLDGVHAFVHRSATYAAALHDRRSWFLRGDRPTPVAWWCSRERLPDPAGRCRAVGAPGPARTAPTAEAFDLRQPFDARADPTAIARA